MEQFNKIIQELDNNTKAAQVQEHTSPLSEFNGLNMVLHKITGDQF